MDDICNYCIRILWWWAKNSPFSYGELNVWLFIIIQPMLIMAFMFTTILGCLTKSNRVKRVLIVITIATFILFVAMTILLFAIPRLKQCR